MRRFLCHTSRFPNSFNETLCLFVSFHLVIFKQFHIKSRQAIKGDDAFILDGGDKYYKLIKTIRVN